MLVGDVGPGVRVHSSLNLGSGQMPLRKGKWTTEEETYASKIILLFNRGMLRIASGTTLRSYLSEKLNCDPMRITKKFAGASCIGKQVFQANDDFLEEEVFECEEELRVLEELFLTRLLGKEAKTTAGGTAAVSVQGRSSGRDRSKNSSSSMNHSEDYYMDDEYGGELDDELGSSSHGGAKAILRSTSDWLLSSKNTPTGRPISRVMSAPALSDLGDYKYQQHAFRALGSVNKGGVRGSSFYGRGGKHSLSPQGMRTGTGTHGTGSGSRRSSLKRTMSVVALDELDPFYGEDKAASDLLLQFVTKVKQDSHLVSASSPHKAMKSENMEQGARTLSPFGGDTGGSSPQTGSGGNASDSSSGENSSSGITTVEPTNEGDDDTMQIQSDLYKGKEAMPGGFMRMPLEEGSKSPMGLDMDC